MNTAPGPGFRVGRFSLVRLPTPLGAIRGFRKGTINVRSRGYTLLELVVVLVIVGVLAGVGSLRYSASLERTRVESAARRVMSDLDHARDIARRSGQNVRIVFSPSQQTYRFTGGDMLGTMLDQDVDLGDDPYRVRMTAADFGGDAVIQFNGYGEPDSGGAIVIAAARSGGHSRKVVVDAMSGTTRLQ